MRGRLLLPLFLITAVTAARIPESLPLMALMPRVHNEGTIHKNKNNKAMDYSGYLQLEQLLATQKPRTDAPDETLFIVQHQTFELWLKVLLKELRDVRDILSDDDSDDISLELVVPKLDRSIVILQHLDHAWTVLQTMSPSGFGRFRHALGSASGMQSEQYRQLMALLGQGQGTPSVLLTAQEPRLYDQVLLHLFRAVGGRGTTKSCAPSRTSTSSESAAAAWKQVYQTPTRYTELHAVAEKLVQLDHALYQWRLHHLGIVDRMIGGHQRGTGGTTGVKHLYSKLQQKCFPDIWNARRAR